MGCIRGGRAASVGHTITLETLPSAGWPYVQLSQASAGPTSLQAVTPATRGLLLLDAGQEDEELLTVRAAPDERHLGVAEHAKTPFPSLVARRDDGVGSVPGMNPEAVDRRLGAVESRPPIQSRPSVTHRARALGRALDST